MKIIMKSTVAGSTGHDGVQIYREGETYSISDSLAAQFIQRGQAVNFETTIEDDVTELQLRCEYQLEFEKGYYPPSYDRWKIERQNKLAALVSEVDVLEAL